MRILLFICELFLFSNSFAQDRPLLQWQKNYGGSLRDTAMDFKLLPDGGFIMTGSSFSNDGDITGNHNPVNTSDACAIRLDQAGNIIWAKCYGGWYAEWISKITFTQDGGFIFVGGTYSNDGDVSGHHGPFGGTADIWVVKLDAAGNIMWQRCYGGLGDDYGADIIETGGGFIVTGGTGSNDGDVSGLHGRTDLWVFKIDPSGNLLWQRCYGGSQPEGGIESTITPTPDGAFILTGTTSSQDGDISNFPSSTPQATWILKISGAGAIIWDKSIAVNNDGGYVNKVIANSNGSLFTSGLTYTLNLPNSSGGDGWAMLLDAAGNTLWVKAFGGSANDRVSDAAKTPDGGYLLTGSTLSSDGSVCQKHLLNNVWLLKMDATGNILWGRTYGGDKHDFGRKLVLIPSGDCYVFCTSSSSDGDVPNNKGASDFWLARFSFNGPLIYPSITISAQTDSIACAGNVVEFTAVTVDGGTNPSYQWKLNGVNTGTNSNILRLRNMQNNDVVSCMLTSNSPCVDVSTANSNNVKIKVGPIVPPKNFLPKDTLLCSYQQIELKANRRFSSYLWSNGSTAESITVKQPGLYWLEVTDRFQCPGRDSFIILRKPCIEGIFIPNAFTPNGDGKNDVFMPFMYADVKQYRFIVYDRWGRIVFETTTLNKGWNGKVKDMPYDSGVFIWHCFYQLEGEEPVSKRGAVLLIR